MFQEIHSVAMLESAAVIVLLLISVFLYRARPQRWLIRWNGAWLIYLAHMQLQFLAVERGGNGLEALGARLLLLASQAIAAVAMAALALRPRWERRLTAAAVLLVGLMLLLHARPGPFYFVQVSGYAFLGFAAAGLGWSYARTRRNVGGWLLVAALFSRALDLQVLLDVPILRLDLLEVVTAVLALSAALVVALEEMRESLQWGSAAGLLSAAVAARGAGLDVAFAAQGASPRQITAQIERQVCRISAAALCRMLLAADPGHQTLGEIFRGAAAAEPAAASPDVAVVRDKAPLEAAGRVLGESGLRGLAIVAVKAGAEPLGLLVIGYRRPILGAPEELRAMAEVGRQIGVVLESARLLEQISRTHREWINTVDSIGDFILVHSRDFRIERVNRALAERVESTPVNLVGRLCRQVLPGAGARWQNCPFCESGGSAEQFDPDFRAYLLVSSSNYPREEPAGVLHVVKDISDRKLAEEKYRHIFENVREGVFVSRPDGRLLDCNEGLARMLGYERAELLRVDIPTMLYQSPDERRRFTELMERQGYVEDYEVRLLRKNGEELLGLETSFATRDETGAVIQYQGFLVDVTERKIAEEEQRRQNEILSQVNALTARMGQSLDTREVLRAVVEEMRRLFDFDTVAVYLADEPQLQVTRPAASGYTSEPGRQLNSFSVTPDVVASLRGATEPVIPIEQLGALPPEVEVAQRAEGMKSIFVVPLRSQHVLGALALANRRDRRLALAEQNLLAAIGRQVSAALENALLYQRSRQAYEDLRQAQEQLLQSAKMAALGQLVSGVAHELNNPLAAIIGYSQLLASHVSPKGADYVDKLLRQAQRTQKIIQNLLSFSRQQKPERQPLDANRVVEDALLLRDYDMRVSNIAVIRRLAGNLPCIMGDRHQLEQVILNIVNNACDAILETKPSGTLEVTTFVEKNGGAQGAGDGAAAGSPAQVVLEFADDGSGLKEPGRVFDPFYTTKKVGKGTGLGLSICYGIVKEHGGEIQAESRSPHGAIFRIRLPAAPAESPEQRIG